MEGFKAALWSGQPEFTDAFHQLITDGSCTDSGVIKLPPNADSVFRGYIETSAYTILVPEAMRMAQLSPFVAKTDIKCPVDDKAQPLYKEGMLYISSTDSPKNRACGADGLLYYLLTVDNLAAPGGCGSGIVNCKQPYLTDVSGADSLNGTAWGGVTVQNLINAAVATYNANGKKNGATRYAPTTKEALEHFWNTGILVENPGVVSIPVCSPREAVTNFATGKKGNNFPCS